MSGDGRKIIRWACVAALAVAGVSVVTVAVVAEESAAPANGEAVVAAATQPASAEQHQGGRREGGGATSRPWRAARAGDDGKMRAPTEEEWRDVAEFMARYSPNRLKAIEEQGGADGPRFANLRKFVFMHYRELQAVKEKGDQELYDLKVQGAQAEDEVFGLQRQMREATDPDRPVLRHQLRQKVGEMVRLGLKERELRIARLEKSLADEKAKLAADQQSVDQRVSERLQSLSKGMRPAGERRRDEGGTPATTSQVK